jgi:hypothetical protein
LWVGAAGPGAGKSREQRGEKRQDTRGERKWFPGSPLSRARPNAFSLSEKKMKTKKAPKLPTHREYTEKQLFGTCFFFMGLFGFFSWAGGPPTSDPDA